MPIASGLTIHTSAEVKDALNNNGALVALESTIITHGMPYPQNLEVAREVETLVRAQGGTPATIAILNGELHVGLEDHELEFLATAENVMKLSRADFGFALSEKRMGSTTVAATMIAAQLAGIKVFATGGIGGVHQGASETFDISADLTELGRTSVTVVAAGPKAILDIPKTLEVLETQGVPVVAFGTDTLPAFWSRESDIPAPLRLDSADQVAAMIHSRSALGLSGGVLVANPVPQADEIPADKMAGFIAKALSEVDEIGITGKAVTPYLLQRIFEITDGASLTTNIALVKNNALVATQIAKALV